MPGWHASKSVRSVPLVSSARIRPELYLLWQPWRQVCIWLSHALRQGVLNVTGQTRLHEVFWFAQLAKQASAAASANCSLVLNTMPGSASAGPIRANTSAAAPYAIFIKDSPNLSTVRNSPFDHNSQQ